jgi:NADH-quinone oxidoreductase subunit E
MEEEPEAIEEYSALDDELLPADEFVEEDDEADEEPSAGKEDLLTVERRTLDGNSGANGENDDLKQIKGVGPAIETTLNELGIFRFNQIAEMSEYDIDRVAQRLKGFRSRIYREDWIGQARDLHYQKNNNPS